MRQTQRFVDFLFVLSFLTFECHTHTPRPLVSLTTYTRYGIIYRLM